MDSSQNSTRPSKNQNQYYSNYFIKYKRKALFQTLYEVSMILISKTLMNIDTNNYLQTMFKNTQKITPHDQAGFITGCRDGSAYLTQGIALVP